ncbi:DNA primase [Alteripontixanthobacter maritimus]|uniref:DNA primase n=1 Tax=Alteripontixanthobacter maritimus TaxID=2161824 RepID=A0A369QAC6_9SPHN|nr:DNA primase [Alteripontixanthobacter maritimus]RDC59869.1 DNA primase [Alteripontixanthobacter maritimus]
MALTPQWLDELRSRITLSAVVGRGVRLQKAGREYRACCPFHDEKTPSFYVNDEKGFYHCFGCEAHGDAIRWLTDQQGLPFMDAVKELALEAGMEVPAPDPRAAKQAEKRASLHDVTQAAQDWFARNLASCEGANARAYLARRGFSDEICRRFGFGFAPSERQAMKGALGQFDEDMLVEAGMRITVDGKDPYDRFRARLMLPIEDRRGRVIAFGGRILEADTNAPKYLNSPDTPLFDKGRTLYNIHRASAASRKTGRVVVVEGYMDVIALAAAGIEDAVAPLGTALTEQQIELLWRMTERPVVCFDGDGAGQRAAMRAVTRALPLLRPSHSLGIVRLPQGLDPDDLVKERGSQAMEDLLAQPETLLDIVWSHEKDAVPLETPEAKAGLKKRLLDHVETIQDPDIRALYKRELLERFSAFAYPPRPQRQWKSGGAPGGRQRGNWKSGAFAPRPTLSPHTAARLRAIIEGGARDRLTSAVFAGLVMRPNLIARHGEALEQLAAADRSLARVIDSLLDAAEFLEPNDTTPISGIISSPAPPDKHRFAFLDEGSDPQAAAEDLAEAISMLVERPALDAALAAATARFETDPEGAYAEQQRLLKRKLALTARSGEMGSRRAAGPAANEQDEPSPGETADGTETG